MYDFWGRREVPERDVDDLPDEEVPYAQFTNGDRVFLKENAWGKRAKYSEANAINLPPEIESRYFKKLCRRENFEVRKVRGDYAYLHRKDTPLRHNEKVLDVLPELFTIAPSWPEPGPFVYEVELNSGYYKAKEKRKARRLKEEEKENKKKARAEAAAQKAALKASKASSRSKTPKSPSSSSSSSSSFSHPSSPPSSSSSSLVSPAAGAPSPTTPRYAPTPAQKKPQPSAMELYGDGTVDAESTFGDDDSVVAGAAGKRKRKRTKMPSGFVSWDDAKVEDGESGDELDGSREDEKKHSHPKKSVAKKNKNEKEEKKEEEEEDEKEKENAYKRRRLDEDTDFSFKEY